MKWKNRYLWGIVGIIIVFLAFNAFLLKTSFSANFHLVDENYYEKEIKYQNRIEQIERTKRLPESVILIDKQPEALQIKIPMGWMAKNPTGTIYFYRPSNAEWDRNYHLLVNNNGLQTISLVTLAKGRWKVAVEWMMDDQSYYDEFNLYIK